MELKDVKKTRILVISNNPFSKTSNNGKTLASFFKNFESTEIAQLYFSSEEPDFELCQNYYRITDRQILKSLFKSNGAGSKVEKLESNEIHSLVKTSKNTKKTDFLRLIREVAWKSKKWKTLELMSWLFKFSPDIIFFCAGDSAFAYDITTLISRQTSAKIVTYITDDYILPRKKASFFWRVRRNIIFRKMKDILTNSSLFITISEEMKAEYKTIFGKDSIVALNMTESMKLFRNEEPSKVDTIQLIYAGGLHFKRDETLKCLAEAIGKYNRITKGRKAFLNIYSPVEPEKKKLKELNIEHASAFLGGLDTETLKLKLNEADIPVHVESFDEKSIESTKLSLSTKIPEYLSLEKAILAIGPAEIGSMKYLKDSAYCITKQDEIYPKLVVFLESDSIRKKLSEKSQEKYLAKHDSRKIRKELQKQILNTLNVNSNESGVE